MRGLSARAIPVLNARTVLPRTHTHLVGVVELVVHESCDDAGLSHALVAQEDLEKQTEGRAMSSSASWLAKALVRCPAPLQARVRRRAKKTHAIKLTSLYFASGAVLGADAMAAAYFAPRSLLNARGVFSLHKPAAPEEACAVWLTRALEYALCVSAR